MLNTVEISPTSFNQYAGDNSEIWDLIIGNEVVHRVWGPCYIEKIDVAKSLIFVSGRKVALSYFRDDMFSGLTVSAEITENIRGFEKQRNELESRRREEEESRKQREAEERVRLLKAQFQARVIDQEKKKLEAIRLEKLREEGENRRRLEFERRAKLQAEQELQRIKEKQCRAKSIQSFSVEREIKKLIHFTRLNNLKSILSHGLLGRSSLERMSSTDRPIFNDAHRFDGYPEAICLSISFPNYRMFYKLNSTNQKEWVLLTLESYILWEFDCAFFEENAASNSAKQIALPRRKEYSSLVQMFMDYPPNKRQDLGIPNNYTTNPQAEVLVLEPIAPKYISEIHFCDRAVMEGWLDENGRNYSQRFIVNREYFSPRVDWTEWQPRNTQTPPLVVDEDLIF